MTAILKGAKHQHLSALMQWMNACPPRKYHFVFVFSFASFFSLSLHHNDSVKSYLGFMLATDAN